MTSINVYVYVSKKKKNLFLQYLNMGFQSLSFVASVWKTYHVVFFVSRPLCLVSIQAPGYD